MILGLGNDLCDIRRIEAALKRHGRRFIDRVFTETEQARAERLPEAARIATYAKRFAAKEACTKALGTGFGQGVYFRDIGVVNSAEGKPSLALTGGAAERLTALTPAGMQAQIDLSMSDEHPLAEAVVVISARPVHILGGM